jgi:PGF-CTERM protein
MTSVTVDELNLSRNTNQGRMSFGPPQTGESYNVDFSIEDQIGGLSASDDPTSFSSADFQYNPANINNDDEYEIRIQETFEVSGSTELAPGTELEIVLQNKAGQTPTFGYTNSTTVDENGEFSVTYTGPQATGTEFELLINATAHPTAPTRSKDGLFREQPTANVTFDNQTRIGGDLVVINQTDLSDGGYIAIHEDNASGPIIGSSKLLPPGSQSNLPIALDYNKTITENTTLVAMPHFDRPGDGFFRFNATTGNDSFYYLTQPVDPGDLPPEGQRTPVTDSAEITFIPQEQQEVTRTVIRTVGVDVTRTVKVPVTRTVEITREVTRTVIDERTVEVPVNVTRTVEVPVEVTRTVEVPVNVTKTVTSEVTRTVEVTRIVNRTSTSGQPGMGALVAVIALLAASLLAVRRRDW